MEEIRHKLKQNKPEITESSLKAYVLNLRKLHQRLHGSKDFTGLDWLQDHEGVMKSLETHCSSTPQGRGQSRRQLARPQQGQLRHGAGQPADQSHFPHRETCRSAARHRPGAPHPWAEILNKTPSTKISRYTIEINGRNPPQTEAKQARNYRI